MIVFNSVRITQDNRTLIIDAEINHSQYFKKMYITNVWIDNQDTYFQNGPSDNPVYHKKIEPTVDENGTQSFNRSIYLAIDKSEIRGSLLNNMLFVYIGVDGIPDPDTPCGLDKNIWLKVTMNTYPLYKKLMQEFTNVSNTCIIPAAKEAGYEFTVEELKSVEKERAEEGAVSEEEMELVGGGLDGVCVLIGSSMDFEQSADASYQKGAHACAFLGVGFGYW